MTRAPLLDAPILDAATFPWNKQNNAASHSDPEKFRERMRKYREIVQSAIKRQNVTAIKPKEKTK